MKLCFEALQQVLDSESDLNSVLLMHSTIQILKCEVLIGLHEWNDLKSTAEVSLMKHSVITDYLQRTEVRYLQYLIRFGAVLVSRDCQTRDTSEYCFAGVFRVAAHRK